METEEEKTEKNSIYNNIENFFNLTGKYKSIAQKYYLHKYEVKLILLDLLFGN
jgi:hypothetical protein